MRSTLYRRGRYILFHAKRHSAEMSAPEITRFLTSLVVDGKVAASNQNRALSALLSRKAEAFRHQLQRRS